MNTEIEKGMLIFSMMTSHPEFEATHKHNQTTSEYKANSCVKKGMYDLK